MGFTFDVELNTAEPFQVLLDLQQKRSQTISGAIVFHLDNPETFKVANISIVGNSRSNWSALRSSFNRRSLSLTRFFVFILFFKNSRRCPEH